jgi:DNA polymerase-1
MRIIQTGDLTPDMPLTANENDWIYNGLDCMVTLEIWQKTSQYLDNMTAGTYAFSRDLQGPILEMTTRGLLVDAIRRQEVLELYKRQITEVAAQLDLILTDGIGLPEGFNWRSPAQLKQLFYGVLGLQPIKKRNANGIWAPTVNREAVEKLSGYFIAEPICIRLLLLRDLEKKRQFLETEVDSDGRIRTNLNIAGTNTGRLASAMSDFGTGGNLQNVDRDLRSVFIADPGMKFCNVDLEQADARNYGAICWNNFVESHGESFAGAYLDACESGDLHTLVCKSAWTNLNWGDDPKLFRSVADGIAYRTFSYRDLAKKLGHGTNFYGQPPTMAKHTKVERSLIEDFQRRYFASFPCIRERFKYVRNELVENGYLVSLFGRRRGFFGRPWEDATLREAVAYDPQSSTADEIDTGLIRLFRSNRVQLLVQVHDSILFQFPEEMENEIVPWAIELLKVHLELKRGRDFFVPTEAKTGWNWGDRTEDKETGTIKNPDGLMKWKGGDDRKRLWRPSRFQDLFA